MFEIGVCLVELSPAIQVVDAVSDGDEDGEEGMADDDDGAFLSLILYCCADCA